MKKFIIVVAAILLAILPAFAQQAKYTYSTHVPSPGGHFTDITLHEQTQPPHTCPADGSLDGGLYFNGKKILICLAGTWRPLDTMWLRTVSPDRANSFDVYPEDTTDFVGIGTSSPEFKLTLDNDGGIIAKGVWTKGINLSTSGAGTRFIWYPKKSALRAGTVGGSQWDDVNIGNYSVAFGTDNTVNATTSSVTGGDKNTINPRADFSFIGGGLNNIIKGGRTVSVIVGGGSNQIDAQGSAIVGGGLNIVAGAHSFIGGGSSNNASGEGTVIPGGTNNQALGKYATISGGEYNRAAGDYSTIGGGGGDNAAESNIASGHFSTISGGQGNRAGGPLATHATVSGGLNNLSSGPSTTVGGGSGNKAIGVGSVVCGGMGNEANGGLFGSATIGGGGGNKALGRESTIGGGADNQVESWRGTIAGGGWRNRIPLSAEYAVISGGSENTAGGAFSTIGGGQINTASGAGSMIPGGTANTAAGVNSWAAGRHAQANADHTFVWGYTPNDDFIDVSTPNAVVFYAENNAGTPSTKVGIGVTNPRYALHVKDVVKIDPRDTPPACTEAGLLYIKEATEDLCLCKPSEGWKNVSDPGKDAACQ